MTPPRARRPSASSRTASSGPTWREVEAVVRRARAEPGRAPVVLVTGGEDLLVQRAVEGVRAAARYPEAPQSDGGARAALDETDVDAATYATGTLAVLASPSLFEEPRFVVLRNLHEGSDDAVLEATAYLADPQPDVVLVLQHGGGVRGKKLLETARARAVAVVDCQAPRNDAALLDFVHAEFAGAGRRVTPPGSQALVDAFGSDLRELASACAQLVGDTVGDVDEAQVRRYYGGRAEATGFEVADAVVARDTDQALLQLRRALDSGLDPIPVIAVLAMKMRQMAKVGSARGRGADVARELGMAPWMVDRARRDLRLWAPAQIAASITALAEADTALKGGLLRGGLPVGVAQDPVFVVEQLVMRMTRS